MAEKKKKYLYVGFYSLPDRDASANRVLSNAKALSSKGNTVIFIDEQEDYPYVSFAKSKHTVDKWDVWSLKRPKGIKRFIRKMITIEDIKYVIKQYEKIDAIIAYNYPSFALYRLYQLCKKKGICVIADCTEWYSGQEYVFPLNLLCAIDSWFRMTIVQKKLSGVMCISSYLFDYYKGTTEVLLVPPLVDKSDKKWKQDKIEFDESKINLVYAGRPGRNKELLLPIIECLRKSVNKQQIIFRIIGITEAQFVEMHPQSIDLIQNMGANLFFYGRIPHNDTIRIITSSDYMIFLRPKNRVSSAGFSTKFVDSVTCGTAVITNNTGDLKKYVDKIGVGYVIENIAELNNVLNMDFCLLKSNGRKLTNVRSGIFDYNEYSERMSIWLNNLIDCV